ncbi:MAG: hypothetical protein LBT76_00415 [Tannerella sp.]|jgi:hypothetical protein|nr:hypothetical protein [Tannerella sp.]
MESKEQLEQLTGHIKRLMYLIEGIHEREIYPVSFFSEAFDITNRMQGLLHQMEVSELALFERQMRVHQAQIRSVGYLTEYTPTQLTPPPAPPSVPEPQEIRPPRQPAPVVVEKSPVTFPPPVPERVATPPPPPSPPPPPKRIVDKQEGRLNETIEKKRLSDLRKAFTLNDRFRFCRDLFAKDENRMNQAIAELNAKDSYETSIAYLQEQFDWNFEDETVIEFTAVLEKRFS